MRALTLLNLVLFACGSLALAAQTYAAEVGQLQNTSTVESFATTMTLQAAEFEPVVDWQRKQNAEQRLEVFGDTALGDGIDPHTGGLIFTHTDIELPGNSQLPVRLVRQRMSGFTYRDDADVEFGDWTLSVPRVAVTSISGRPWQGARCSQPVEQLFPIFWMGQRSTSARDYSNGVVLEIPGQPGEQLLDSTNSPVFPAHAKKVTRNYWYFTCITASDGGEGFIGHAPNGDRYRFDRAYLIQAPMMGYAGANPLARNRYMLAATEVTDVHGNKVNYVYDSANRLQRIHASDGREIRLAYNGTSRLVANATAEGQTWSYQYRASTHLLEDWIPSSGRVRGQVLSKVIQPDGHAWQFTLDAMAASPAPAGRDYCPKYQHTVSVTHPYGLTGTFVLRDTEHRQVFALQTRRTEFCISREPLPIPDGPGGTLPWDNNITTQTISVVQKTLTGPAIPAPLNWTYRYERDRGASGSSTADRTNWTEVTAPEAHYTYYHAWVSEPLSGKLVRKDTRAHAGGALLRSEIFTYEEEATLGYFYFLVYAGPQDVNRPVHKKQQLIRQNGDEYRIEYQYSSQHSASTYSFGHPVNKAISSNVFVAPRNTQTTYQHDRTRWILGLPKTVSVNGLSTRTYQYNSYGKPTSEQRYGQPFATFDYYSNGTVAWARDALNRTHYARDYRAGVPQTVERADGSKYYQYVDGFGRLIQVTDPMGVTTTYERDAVGRLQRVLPPSPWAPTIHDYDFNGSLTHRIERGNSRTEIIYDALFRAVTVSITDTLTGEIVVQNFTYDSQGRETFASMPALGSATTAGIETTYDALGRPLQTRETVSPFAITTHTYLAGHRHRVTDAAGEVTIYTFDGYAGPESQDVHKIDSPENTQTVITRNQWGEITHVRQHGNHNGYLVDQTRQYIYNAARQVCRIREPDVGDTLYAYDAAGGLRSYAKGMPGGTTCTTPGGSGAVTLTRDALGRLRQRSFGDGTAQINYDLDANSNLTRITRGGVVWTYLYNNLNLLLRETLSVDQRQYVIGYAYNNAGHRTSQTLPGGLTLVHDPDGLGRARRAGNFAHSATYHANQHWRSYQLGNGIAVTQSLDSRGQPRRLLARTGSRNVLDLTYTFDARRLLTNISDAVDNSNSRQLGYDGQERLVSAAGPWGSGAFGYDSLGNLRYQQLGSRHIDIHYDDALRVIASHDSGGLGGKTGSREFLYDSRGNVTKAGAQVMEYDRSERVTRLTGAAQGTYIYDGHLRRVRSDVNGARRYHVYSLAGELLHVDAISTAQRTDYVRLGSHTVARVTNGVPTYLHHDLLGSPVAGTDAQAQVQWRERYTPFGDTIDNPNANAHLAGYTGHVRDAETGLVYMQARYYDPVIGRFYSNDPVGFTPSNPMMFNRYAYANNNPYKFVDPDGRMGLLLMPKITAPPPAATSTSQGTDISNGDLLGIGDSLAGSKPFFPDLSGLLGGKGSNTVFNEKGDIATGDGIDKKDTSTWPKPPVDGKVEEGLPSRYKPASRGEKSLYDEKGGEWRPHTPDKHHEKGHWDYKSQSKSKWLNIDTDGKVIED